MVQPSADESEFFIKRTDWLLNESKFAIAFFSLPADILTLRDGLRYREILRKVELAQRGMIRALSLFSDLKKISLPEARFDEISKFGIAALDEIINGPIIYRRTIIDTWKLDREKKLKESPTSYQEVLLQIVEPIEMFFATRMPNQKSDIAHVLGELLIFKLKLLHPEAHKFDFSIDFSPKIPIGGDVVGDNAIFE